MSRGRAVAIVAAFVVLLAVVYAGASGRGRVRSGTPHQVAVGVGLGLLSTPFVLAALAVVGAGLFALARHRRHRKSEQPPEFVPERLPVPWWIAPVLLLLLALVVAGLVIGAIALGHAGVAGRPSNKLLPLPTSVATGVPVSSPISQRPGRASQHWWVLTVGTLVALAAVLGFGGLLWRVRFRRGRAPARAADVTDVGKVLLDEMADDVTSQPNPRLAILAAYRRMERVLGDRGVGRLPADAPLEWLRRVVAELPVSSAAAGVLVELFELAAFSRRPLTAADRVRALIALRALSEDGAG